jgi:hypothetical protein
MSPDLQISFSVDTSPTVWPTTPKGWKDFAGTYVGSPEPLTHSLDARLQDAFWGGKRGGRRTGARGFGPG